MRTDYFPIIRHSFVTAATVLLFVFASFKTATFSHSQAALQETDSPGAVFTVTTTADSGAGSLRQAITDANATAGADTINFNIPGGGFQTILLTSDLPTITDPVTIDGTTQPGYSGTPLVVFSGRRLHITAGSSTVKAIAIIRELSFGGITLETGGGTTVTGCFLGINPANEADTTTGNFSGVEITNSANNQIGGNLGTSLRNVMAYNTGVRITGAGSTGNVVIGNIIGLRSNGNDTATGTSQSRYAVYIEGSSNNRVGGTTAAERNILSGFNGGNSTAGIWLLNASGTQVQGNYIGTDITGTLARPNRDGIRIDESPNNMIGDAAGTTFAGPCTGGCNLISGNFRDGVRLNGAATTGNRLDYNYIGMTASGLTALRNGVFAIHFTNAPNNIIGKPLVPAAAPRHVSGLNGIPNLITVENENLCITINTDTNTHTITPKRGGQPILGTGESSTDAYGIFRYVSHTGQDPAVLVVMDDPKDLLAWTSVEFANLPHFAFWDQPSFTTGCTTSIEGEQPVNGIIADDTNPGSTGNTIIGNNVGGSVNGIDNLALANEVPLQFIFGSDLHLDENTIFSRSLQSITVQNGVGVENANNRFIFLTLVPFSLRPDPKSFDLTTGAANHGLSAPTDVRVLRSGSTTVSGAIQGPSDTTLRLNLSGQFHYRRNDGTQDVTTIPLSHETLITTDAAGNANFDIETDFLFGEYVVAKMTVVPPSPFFGSTSEYSRLAKVPKGILDFDGDGRTDISVVRPGMGNTESYWYILNSYDGTFRAQQYGLGDDRPVPGDYQGDGVADFAVWRPSTSTDGQVTLFDPAGGVNSVLYHSRLIGDPAANFASINWGLPTDIPVVGDFDDDGANDAAVFRPSDRTWYIRGSIGGRLIAQQWGLATDKLVPADYDGDGDTDIAVYRNGIWYISVCAVCPLRAEHFGLSSDVPVPADYDGDGIDDIAVWRPSDGIWYIQQSTAGFRAVQWGLSGDKVLNGDFDGDGKNDISVWRPSDGNWYILRSSDGAFSATHWGQNGDIPVSMFPNQ